MNSKKDYTSKIEITVVRQEAKFEGKLQNQGKKSKFLLCVFILLLKLMYSSLISMSHFLFV